VELISVCFPKPCSPLAMGHVLSFKRRAATLEALRAEVKKGLASGKGQPAEEVFERLERKYANPATTRRSK